MDPPKFMLLLLCLFILSSNAGKVYLNNYSIAASQLYSRNRFIFDSTSKETPGMMNIEIVATPYNFKEGFEVYFLIGNKEDLSSLESMEDGKKICSKIEKNHEFENLMTNKKMVYSQVTSNGFQNMIFSRKIKVNSDGEYHIVLLA